ncbi:MAG: hypothetical protein ABIP93_01375 [Gemmatimonadaceae bacterium]
MRSRIHLLAVITFVLVAPAGAQAQSLAQRVRNAPDGAVELRYAVRPGVCGDGRNYFSIGGSMRIGQFTTHNGKLSTEPCLPGPVRVRLLKEGGAVRVTRVDVGTSTASALRDAEYLGVVSAPAAAEYFLDLASGDAGGSGAKAVTAAVLADSTSVWRRLLVIARDADTRPKSTRREASFWLAQFVAAKLDGRDESLASFDDDDDARDDAKSSAIFALSQLHDREGIDPLLQIARTNRESRLRRKALFWLGQSDDPRALALFGEILSRS